MDATKTPQLPPPEAVPRLALDAIFPRGAAVAGRAFAPLTLASIAALARMGSPSLSGVGRLDLPAAVDVLFAASLSTADLGRAMAMDERDLRAAVGEFAAGLPADQGAQARKAAEDLVLAAFATAVPGTSEADPTPGRPSTSAGRSKSRRRSPPPTAGAGSKP